MDNNGISDMSHLLSVEVEGFKFAVELGKDAVKFLQRLAAIFSNALKWGMIDKSWRYFKDSGQTNTHNVKKLHASDATSTLPLNKADFAAWQKFAKKYGIVYCKLPGADKNTINVMIGNNDVPLIKLFEDICKDKLTKEQARKGAKSASVSESDAPDLEKVDAEVVYEPPHVKNWNEYMYDNGFMDCSQEKFDDVLRETYGEQCTTLTQFIDRAMEGADPAVQKKRSAEIFERCRKEDLNKEARAGALVVTFEKERFAGYDRKNKIVFFQMVRKPPRWIGIPVNRLNWSPGNSLENRKKDFTAVLNEQSQVKMYDIKFDKTAPKGFVFKPQEDLDIGRIKELASVFDKDIIDLEKYADQVVDLHVMANNRSKDIKDALDRGDEFDYLLENELLADQFMDERSELLDEAYYEMKRKGVSKSLRGEQIDQIKEMTAVKLNARNGRKR